MDNLLLVTKGVVLNLGMWFLCSTQWGRGGTHQKLLQNYAESSMHLNERRINER